MNTLGKQEHHFSLSWLANTVTLFNLFTGFLSIWMVTGGRIRTAAWLIFISLLWDSLDGNIARALKNPTPFGRELDSLSDIVSFVVAPALLALKSCYDAISFWDLLPIFLYLAAGAYRLARFNVRPTLKNYFQGLPTPAAAVILAMIVLSYQKNGWIDHEPFMVILAVLMIFLSFLMISEIMYPKLSAIKFSKWRSFFYLESLIFTIVFTALNFETALGAIFLVFLVLAPAYAFPAYQAEEKSKEGLITKGIK